MLGRPFFSQMTEIRKKLCSIYLFCSNFLAVKTGWKKAQLITKIRSLVFLFSLQLAKGRGQLLFF